MEANEALALAAAAGPVVPVFVVDERLWGPSGANRQWFLAGSLADLDAQLEGRLVLRRGNPAEVLAEIAAEAGATTVFATDDFGPYGRARDTAVGEALAARGIATSYRSSNYAVAPGNVFSKTGTAYKVFTPFYKQWIQRVPASPAETADLQFGPAVESHGLPKAPSVTASSLPTPGIEAAWDRFDLFKAEIAADYPETRNLPGIDGTSRLSAYLKWGTIHPLQVMDRLGDSVGEQEFIRQLCWRDFYGEVLFNRPDSAREAYVAANVVATDSGPKADDRFQAWCAGQTGFPIVDAGMRQLVGQGWMHNRVRMITASFLVKDLHLPWQWGARFFMEHLVDGDLASNNHGWQWVAGTGTDASPYYRVFNPTTQSAKFDKGGDFLRQWVPEIAHLGDKVIHDPSSDPHGAPPAYTAPMVDHAAERLEALARNKNR